MTKNRSTILLIAIPLYLASACTSVKTIKPFKSDGCSLFPDQSLITNDVWYDCCAEHDFAYWRGGTREQREAADKKFRECILAITQDTVLADVMYTGVRLGGSPYFPTWYRWGYGWNYQRGYAPLSSDEISIIEKKLRADADTIAMPNQSREGKN